MYRAVTLLAAERGVEDAAGLSELARTMPLRFDGTRVFLGDREVTRDIRSEPVNLRVSAVSAVPEVRAELLERQRELGRAHAAGAVLEGRDIGTVVFPDAEVKVFLTASPEERAQRRHAEVVSAGGDESFDAVLEGIRRRDRLDGTRSVAPLRPAEDAIQVDTTGKTFNWVVEEVVRLIRARLPSGPAPANG